MRSGTPRSAPIPCARSSPPEDPDLIILPVDRVRRRTFLLDGPLWAFSQDLTLYIENLRVIPFGDRLGPLLLKRSALLRTAAALLNRRHAGENERSRQPYVAAASREALKRFLAEEGKRAKVVLLYFDADRPIPPQDLGAPWISLNESRHLPRNAPPEYYLVHPPAEVYALQAGIIARELAKIHPGLFPARAGRGARLKAAVPAPLDAALSCAEFAHVRDCLRRSGNVAEASRWEERMSRRGCVPNAGP